MRIVMIEGQSQMSVAQIRLKLESHLCRRSGPDQPDWTFIETKPVQLGRNPRCQRVGQREFRIQRNCPIEQRQSLLSTLLSVTDSAPSEKTPRPQINLVRFETRRWMNLNVRLLSS